MRCAASWVFLAVLAGLLVRPADAGGKGGKDSYLTAGGKLKAALEVLDVQGGFAGFTGTEIKVARDGKWEVSRAFQKKRERLSSGELNEGQLKKLAAALAKYDLLGLKDEGKAGANPHRVTIQFGKHRATLTLGAGKPLPPPSTTEVAGRYSGIVTAVRALVKKGDADGKK
jgi:hypothetical protein